MNLPRYWVVIPAAGLGKRMQAERPKQYLLLAGKTVLEHTMQCLAQHPQIAGMVVVLSAEDHYWPKIDQQAFSLPVYTTLGGKERVESVTNGLLYLRQQQLVAEQEYVLVHDAARPCLSLADLSRLLIKGALSPAGAILAAPVRDTMKRAQANSSCIQCTEAREGLWHALTPQMAPLGILLKALQQGLAQGRSITDEASALEYMGLQPLLVEGAASNIKITHPADLALAAFFLANYEDSHAPD